MRGQPSAHNNGKMEGGGPSLKTPSMLRITSLAQLNDCLNENNISLSRVYTPDNSVAYVNVKQKFGKTKKKGNKVKATKRLTFPDVDAGDVAKPSMRFHAGVHALEVVANLSVSTSRSFEDELSQFDRMVDVKLDQKAQAGIDAGQYTGSKRQLDLLEAEFMKKEKRRRIELEVQAEVEGLAELSAEKVEAFIATNVLNDPERAALIREKTRADAKDGLTLS